MRFRRRLQPNATPDLVPLIDVVFQLVIFFMVSSTFVMTPGLDLDLPESGSADTISMTNLVISVRSSDELYLNEEQYDLEGLSEALAEIDGSDEEEQPQSIVVEGDSSVQYDLMIAVLDVLRENGFRGASLRTRETDPDL
ncbi:MAG: ExbD/TolR family protein [Spirochaetia bacterium]